MDLKEKELLFKDLCGRLPYGVYCQIRYKRKNKVIEECKQLDGAFFSDSEFLFRSESGAEYSADYRPYLRPMSSMTDKERAEKIGFLWEFEGHINEDVTYKYQDWLNVHHFDYRGLIPMGLAIEVTEENNPYKINGNNL